MCENGLSLFLARVQVEVGFDAEIEVLVGVEEYLADAPKVLASLRRLVDVEEGRAARMSIDTDFLVLAVERIECVVPTRLRPTPICIEVTEFAGFSESGEAYAPVVRGAV